MTSEVVRCFELRENWRRLWTRSASARHAHLDGLRALSMLWVIVMHVVFVLGLFLERKDFVRLIGSPFMNPLIQGHYGVDVFFVLSGFLIGSLLMTEWKATGGIRFARFYARRALRLLPAYVVAILVYGILVGENLGSLWANLLYVNNYLPARDQFMIWTWSLAIEEQFYVICPIVLVLILGQGRAKTLPLLLVGLGCSFLVTAFLVIHHGFRVPVVAHPAVDARGFYRVMDHLYGRTHARFGGLLIGIIVAYVHHFTAAVPWLDRHPRAAKAVWGGSLSIFTLFLMFTPFKKSAFTDIFGRLILICDRNVLSLTIGYVVLFGLTQRASRSRLLRWLRKDFWYPIAQLSYSAYLTHISVMLVGYKLLLPIVPGSRTSLLLYVPGFTLVTLVLSGIIFLSVEMPFMRMRELVQPLDTPASGRTSVLSSRAS